MLNKVYLIIILFLASVIAILYAMTIDHAYQSNTLFTVTVIVFAINWLAYIPAALYQTEKYYDLVGGISYIVAILLTFALSVNRPSERQLLLAIAVLIWAFRLGLFLAIRVHKRGHDSRFDKLKVDALRFLIPWTLQALWVSITISAAIAGILSNSDRQLGLLGYFGIMLWLFGFTFEVIADYQKFMFNSLSENKGNFINKGLWRYCQHPNYFGEITLWVGVLLIAGEVLTGLAWLTIASPILVILLLTQLSGIPPLRTQAIKRWGNNAEWLKYYRETPILIPWRLFFRIN